MSTLALILLAVAGVALLLFLIIILRLQAFIALLLVSLVVAVIGGVPIAEVADTIVQGMGGALGYIAIVVGIGTMFGEMLQVSGGARQISNTLIRRFGEKRSPWALALIGLIVSVPVFLDVAFILFVPLVYSMAQRTGKSLLFYAIPLLGGMAVGHSFIPPTPGPVAVASILNADLGWVILFGLLAGIPAAMAGGVFFGKFIAGRIHLEVPEYMLIEAPAEEKMDEKKVPSFGLVVFLIVFPLALILFNTGASVVLPEGTLRSWATFIGHPTTALLLTAMLSFYLLGTRLGYTADEVQQVATRSLEPVGLIILVTGAGGVFGRILIATGIGDALAEVMSATQLPIILLAFAISAVVRISQGSATVSMVTAASLVLPMIELGDYPPAMIGAVTIAIASGATILSHVNDSGFWLVSRFLGMTEKQTLRSWTIMETIIGFVGLIMVLILSVFI